MTNKSDCDEAILTKRAASGDLKVLTDIVACYGRSLLTWASNKCQNNEDAQDTVQDVYLSVQRFLPGFKGDASLRTWLYRLMISACIRRRRGLKNKANIHVSFSTEHLSVIQGLKFSSSVDPEDKVFIKELGEVLSQALLELGENDRAIVIMKDGEGLSMKEISEKLNIGISAIKSRLFRARKRLRKKIEGVLQQRETLLS